MCGLWDGMWNVVRCGTKQCVGCDTAQYVVVRCGKWWAVEYGGVPMCDVECYVKHGSGM